MLREAHQPDFKGVHYLPDEDAYALNAIMEYQGEVYFTELRVQRGSGEFWMVQNEKSIKKIERRPAREPWPAPKLEVVLGDRYRVNSVFAQRSFRCRTAKRSDRREVLTGEEASARLAVREALDDCIVSGSVDLAGWSNPLRSFRVRNCRIAGDLRLRDLHVAGDMEFDRLHVARGTVDLRGMRVGGNVRWHRLFIRLRRTASSMTWRVAGRVMSASASWTTLGPSSG